MPMGLSLLMPRLVVASRGEILVGAHDLHSCGFGSLFEDVLSWTLDTDARDTAHRCSGHWTPMFESLSLDGYRHTCT